MRKIAVCFFMITLMFAAGCGQASAPKNTTPGSNTVAPPLQNTTPSMQSYFPITSGSSWSYQGEGNEYASFTREVSYMQNNRGQFKESNGGTVTTQVFQVTDTDITRVYFLGEDYQAANLFSTGFSPNDNSTVLKAPLQAGTTWISGGIEKRIVSTDAKVTTPAGSFDSCIQVESKHTDSVVYEYFKAGVGMVKREFKSGNETISSSLAAYKIMP